MNTNILVSSKEKEKKRFIIGTHDGIFHSDEVVACAILALFHSDDQIVIVRSKDVSLLQAKEANILVDVGGGLYDHHQPGGNGKRKNGVPYASAGLVWREYGEGVIYKCFDELYSPSSSILADNPTKTYESTFKDIVKDIDENLIQNVDKEDNGISVPTHAFSFITSFLPVYGCKQNSFDEGFQLALNVTIEILKHAIYAAISKELTLKLVLGLIEEDGIVSHSILEIPSQTFPWLEALCNYNIDFAWSDTNCINFVIFPYPSGGWAAQCVPPSLEKKFEQRISFPKEWAGQTENLPKISGVKDATFCHNGCFFVRAKTKEGVIALCENAIKANKSS